MKICVDKSLFAKVLTHQQLLINRRSNTVPILSHILLEAQYAPSGEPILSVHGTDMEMSLWEKESLKDLHVPGSSVVCAQLLYEIVRKIDDQWVTLESYPDYIHVQGGAAEFKLPTLAVADFPLMEPQNLPCEVKVEAKALADLIRDTSFCIATEETRYALGGTCFHFREQENKEWSCNVVATDGHRLALSQWKRVQNTTESLPSTPSILVIGRRTIQSMLRLLESDSEEIISFGFSSNQISLRGKKFQFFSRLLIDRFPDYMGAIPKDHTFNIQFDPKELIKSLDRVGMVIEERTRSVKLDFHKSTMTLSANSAQGSAREVVKILYDGEKSFSLMFNIRYLSEICQHARGSEMVMQGSEGQNPVLFQELNRDTLYVLMPISNA